MVALEHAATAFQAGTVRIPVQGEEAYAEKMVVVVGEVVVTKRRVVERREITGIVRKEHIQVDERYGARYIPQPAR